MSQYRYVLFRNGIPIHDEEHLIELGERELGDILYYRDATIKNDPHKWYIYKAGSAALPSFMRYSDVLDQLKLTVILLGEEP